jgi:hypothetical protein
MRSILMLAATVTCVLGIPNLAAAQAPAAVVEDVKGRVAGIEFMDYVSPGFTIELGSQDTVVLGYLKSCIREIITGGTVVVGLRESRVHHGRVERATVDCDAGRIRLSDKEASQGAAASFRSVAKDIELPLQTIDEPPIVIYGLSPIVETNAIGKLTIRRLDAKGERREVVLTPQSLSHRRFYDFARANGALTAGGSYVATLGTSKAYFKIDPQAKPGATPIIGRLVRLQ